MQSCFKKFSSTITGLAFNFVCKILRYFGYSVKKIEKCPSLPKCTSSPSRRLDVSRVVRQANRLNSTPSVLIVTQTGGLILDNAFFEDLSADTEAPEAWQSQEDIDREELLSQFQNFDPET